LGGGRAGLALGGARQRSGVPVSRFAAGDSPWHRVGGEFAAGPARATADFAPTRAAIFGS